MLSAQGRHGPAGAGLTTEMTLQLPAFTGLAGLEAETACVMGEPIRELLTGKKPFFRQQDDARAVIRHAQSM
jgi:hypothetical protein